MTSDQTTELILHARREADTRSFMRARPRLLRIARHMLGSATDADDVVQEAWLRWQDTDRSVVRDPAAFLATTTVRLALNVARGARARHEADSSPQLHLVADSAADPRLGVERRDALELALWMVLERLSPTEQAVYVLREAFDYPHRRAAELAGLSEANARQLVNRARARISGPPRHGVTVADHRRLVGAFLAAASSGDLSRLEHTLVAAINADGDSRVRAAA